MDETEVFEGTLEVIFVLFNLYFEAPVSQAEDLTFRVYGFLCFTEGTVGTPVEIGYGML